MYKVLCFLYKDFPDEVILEGELIDDKPKENNVCLTCGISYSLIEYPHSHKHKEEMFTAYYGYICDLLAEMGK